MEKIAVSVSELFCCILYILHRIVVIVSAARHHPWAARAASYAAARVLMPDMEPVFHVPQHSHATTQPVLRGGAWLDWQCLDDGRRSDAQTSPVLRPGMHGFLQRHLDSSRLHVTSVVITTLTTLQAQTTECIILDISLPSYKSIKCCHWNSLSLSSSNGFRY